MICCSSGVGTSEERPLYSVAQLAETLFAAQQPQSPVRRQRYATRAFRAALNGGLFAMFPLLP